MKILALNFIRQPTEKTNFKSFKQPDITEVYILGILHKSTDLIDYDDLYNLLEIIKPNIILYERDSLSFDNNMNLKTAWWKLKLPQFLNKFKQDNLEEISVQKYLYHNKFAIVRPYEWSLRDKFHEENHINTTPNKIFQKLDLLNSKDQLTENQTAILENYYRLSHKLNKFEDSTLYQINTIYQDSIAKKRQNAQYHEIKAIIDSNVYLKEFREFYKINEEYWDIRNKSMSNNIKRYIKLFPNSRIVVLNGYFHRYYLRQELIGSQAELNFKLNDVEK
jgi:hypothetical protein